MNEKRLKALLWGVGGLVALAIGLTFAPGLIHRMGMTTLVMTPELAGTPGPADGVLHEIPTEEEADDAPTAPAVSTSAAPEVPVAALSSVAPAVPASAPAQAPALAAPGPPAAGDSKDDKRGDPADKAPKPQTKPASAP